MRVTSSEDVRGNDAHTPAPCRGGSRTALIPKRCEYPLAFFSGEDGALRTLHAGRVQVFGMVFEVEEHYLLRDAVEDMLGGDPAALAEALFAAQFSGQTAQARYAVGAEDAHV